MKDMFEETVERVLGDLVTPEGIAAAEGGAWPHALWSAIDETGLALAAAPEESGGVGGRWLDVFGIVRSAGRHAAPVPLAETVLANWVLGLAGMDVAPGAATITQAVGSLRDGRFTGTLTDVPWGATTSHVVALTDDSAPNIVMLSSADATASKALNTAREPRDMLVFKAAEPVAVAPLPASLPTNLLLLGGAMIRSAQIAGGLERLLDIAIDYANQRVQFGRPIGKFQAVQHQLALLAEHTALASSAAEAAFASSEHGPNRAMIAAAKSVSSEAAGQGAAIAHAILGAIGFTYEHALHFTTRRLWSWRSEFGSQTYWAQAIGREMCKLGPSGFWPAITSIDSGE
jgi:acyl-CoA dehydrogenase